MKSAFCIIVTVLFFSCVNKSAISKKLSESDSLVITFNVPGSDSVLNIVSTTEKKAIRKITSFLNGKNGVGYQCGFDGNMIFFRQGEILLTVIFQYSDKSCSYFLFDLDNKIMNTSMSNGAAEVMKSLSEGKTRY